MENKETEIELTDVSKDYTVCLKSGAVIQITNAKLVRVKHPSPGSKMHYYFKRRDIKISFVSHGVKYLDDVVDLIIENG